MKPVVYSKDATKALRRIQPKQNRIIIAKIEQYATDPTSLANNVKALQGDSELLRLRVGDWRILMRDNEVLFIEKIGPRGSVYE